MQETTDSDEKITFFDIPFCPPPRSHPVTFSREQVRSCFQELHKQFVEIEDVTSEKGLSRSKLVMSMRFFSFARHNDIKMYHPNDHSIIFCCALADPPVNITPKRTVSNSTGADAGQDSEGEEITKAKPPEQRERNKGCGFYLRFDKRSKCGVETWILKNTSENWFSFECNFCRCPSLCVNRDFLVPFLKTHVLFLSEEKLVQKLGEVISSLKQRFNFDPPRKTLDKSWKIVLGNDLDSVLRQNQQVQDYLLKLNQNEQYGVILYMNGRLLVPSADCSSFLIKQLDLDKEKNQFCPEPSDGRIHYWDNLLEGVTDTEGMCIRMTFQAIAAAVKAIPFCIPVICLDACTIRSYHTRGVMLAATVATNEMKLLTFCTGTALKENVVTWNFFLVNLRQVLTKFCPGLDLGTLMFMSDRHEGIIKGVEKHFPNSRHLFCMVHLVRNMGLLKGNRHLLWKVSESETEEEFETSFRNLLASCDKAAPLLKIADHWVRCRIIGKYRRFGVRTNNWAEVQNNAMMFLRGGSILTVLTESFKYTSRKIQMFYRKALELYHWNQEKGRIFFTKYASDMIRKNMDEKYRTEYSVTRQREDFFLVKKKDTGKEYFVNVDQEHPSCSCLFFKESGIPCIHFILALKLRVSCNTTLDQAKDTHLPEWQLAPYIDKFYCVSRFFKAFPSDNIFFPDDVRSYAVNRDVVLPPRGNQRGAPQWKRYFSKGEPRNGSSNAREAPPPKEDNPDKKKSKKKAGTGERRRVRSGESNDERWLRLNEAIVNGNYDNISDDDVPSDDENDDDGNEDNEFYGVDEYDELFDDSVDSSSCCTSTTLHRGDLFGEDDIVIYASDDETVEIIMHPQTRSSRQGQRQEDEDLPGEEVSSQQFSCFPPTVQPLHRLEPENEVVIQHESNPQQSLQGSPDKRPRTITSVVSNEVYETELSGKKYENTSGEKIGMWIETINASNFCGSISFYHCFVQSRLTPDLLKPNCLPSPEHKVLIPFVFPIDQYLEGPETPKHFEPYSSSRGRKFSPTVSEMLIKQFLSLVHLNTIVGLPSQGLAFSASPTSTVNFIGILPQQSSGSTSAVTEQEAQMKTLFKGFSEQNPSQGRRKYTMRCLLITHPTSDPFLTSKEIAQLFQYTCSNDKCFAIVISPRNNGLKALCAKLTDEGFGKLKEFEEIFNSSSTADESFKLLYLKKHIETTGFNYYRQIPCRLMAEPCFFYDSRDFTSVIRQVKEFAFSDDADYW